MWRKRCCLQNNSYRPAIRRKATPVGTPTKSWGGLALLSNFGTIVVGISVLLLRQQYLLWRSKPNKADRADPYSCANYLLAWKKRHAIGYYVANVALMQGCIGTL